MVTDQALAEGGILDTGVNHLVRREAGYWFRRRIPQAIAAGFEDSVARSLRMSA